MMVLIVHTALPPSTRQVRAIVEACVADRGTDALAGLAELWNQGEWREETAFRAGRM